MGGYLIPKKSLEFTKILYSFGLEADWSFEEDFFKRAKSTIYCYDHTVNWTAKNSNLKKIMHNEVQWIKKFRNIGLTRKFKNYKL